MYVWFERLLLAVSFQSVIFFSSISSNFPLFGGNSGFGCRLDSVESLIVSCLVKGADCKADVQCQPIHGFLSPPKPSLKSP